MFYPDITEFMTAFSRTALTTFIPVEFTEVVVKSFIFQQIHILNIPGGYPSLGLSIGTVLVSLLFIYLLIGAVRELTPVAIWALLLLFVTLTSGLFFIFFADWFPYGTEIFSELYIKTEVAMWLVIPAILTLAIIPLPGSVFGKFLFVTLTLAYDIIFACLRYILFLYLLRETTFLYMAGLLFIFGPLIDFLAMVGFYSVFVCRVGKKINRDMRLWKWLY
jgi:hypothetical protein